MMAFHSVSLFAQEETNYADKLGLENPVKYEAYYDYTTGSYILYPKVNGVVVGTPITMTSEEYNDYVLRDKLSGYYREKSRAQDNIAKNINENKPSFERQGIIAGVRIKSKLFETIFGGDRIELRPTGFASFDLGVMYQKIDNPQILPQNRENFTIDLRQRIQMSLRGSVGKNLNLSVNYDTQAGFNFENRLNLAWKPDLLSGGEDQIIKNIEFGNINMPLSTSLLTGPQALFGVKGEFQFGNTYLTTVFSEQQSEARQITVQNGGLISTFKIPITEYEAHRHYFLNHYFRNSYDKALLNYPVIDSRINIIKLEVWKIEKGNSNLQNQRSVLALRDLGETTPNPIVPILPDNSNNNLYSSVIALGDGIRDIGTARVTINNQFLPDYNSTMVQYQDGENFSVAMKARKLDASEYTFKPQLGYISLNQTLADDDGLAVAFQYTYTDPVTGVQQVKKVGEFADENSKVLIVKLLKSESKVNTASPTWNLMMKNIYPMDAYQLSPDNFILNVTYQDASQGKITYLPAPNLDKKQLIKLLNWDRLSQNADATSNGQGDGIFDFIDGITVDAQNGKLIYTKVEPFGSYLVSVLDTLAHPENKIYIFDKLYNSQKSEAISDPLAHRYNMEGRFKGTVGNGISLGAYNVPRGSVKVTANGQALTEGADYVVDYQMGTVTILNENYKNSQVPINISLENQEAFSMQKKRFMGLNVEHKFSQDFVIGATYLNYKERPLTQKVQYGAEAVNNSMVGFNIMYNKEVPFLTKLANWIPGVKTEAPSNLSLKLEGAALIPGENNATDGQSYIDDFETASSKISLKDPNYWGLASMPEKNNDAIDPEFKFGKLNDDLQSGYGRGLMSWYNIDPRFYGIGGGQPSGVDNQARSLNLQRRVLNSELFTQRDYIAGEQLYMNTFDVSFYPSERGPYNFNSSGENPKDRWGGIMRAINVTNFSQSNIEYVEFWMMDPYADNNGASLGANPQLLIQLGNVSEDVLKDGKLFYENGLPNNAETNETTESNWGRQPKNFPLVYAFNADGDSRKQQDVGYDGLGNEDEISFFPNFSGYLNPVTGINDPAADDFVFYMGDFWDSSSQYKSSIVDRYKYFRNPEGNSPAGTTNAATSVPDAEDINRDYNLDQNEDYNQYRISLTSADLSKVGGEGSFVADKKTVQVTLANGKKGNTTWYLVRIPVRKYESGSDDILNNVRFIRMLMKGFDKTATLRFATFDLVRSEWRLYDRTIASNASLAEETEGQSLKIPVDNLILSSVNLEENSTSTPPYVMPPGVEREKMAGATGTQLQNEASLKLEVHRLKDDEPRAIYKNMEMDMRRYKKLSMFIHAENLDTPTSGDLDKNTKFFIRLGNDLSDNYYEYEISLKYTPNTATSATDIWPIENTIDLDLNDLVKAKAEKDKVEGYSSPNRFKSTITGGDENKAIYVRGRPSIGNVTTIMMGVRNNVRGTADKNLILWLDELRLSGIDNENGYAAVGSLNFNLADFADVSVTGRYQSVGFGAIDSRPSERTQDETKEYVVNAAVNLDKTLPAKWGMRIPVNVGIAESFIDPKYNPLDNDVEFKNDPRKEELKKIVRTYSVQRNFSVNNLRKERTSGKKPKFYDVENLTASFMYSTNYYRDIYTTYNLRQQLQASLDYNFSPQGKYYQPFAKWSAVQDTSRFSKFLRWVKEFNVNPVPTRISFRADILRIYNEFEYRDIEAYLNGVSSSSMPIYSNNFVFGWQYNIGFNLTRSLKIDYSSATRTIVDEMGTANFAPDNQMIWGNLFKIGRPINYTQRLQLNYKVPIHLLPYLDFTSLEVGYTGQYDWQASSTYMTGYVNPETSTSTGLGNTAQNSQIINVMGNADFTKFYEYFKSHKKFEERRSKRQRESDSLTRAYEANSQLKRPKAFKWYTLKNHYKPTDYLWMILSSIKRGQFQYAQNRGMMLPGFLSEPNFFGVGSYNGSTQAPTIGFLFGSQFDIRNKAITEGWVSPDPMMLNPFMRTKNEQMTGNIQLEPINQLHIDLDFMKNSQETLLQQGYNLRQYDAATHTYLNAPSSPRPFENKSALFSSSVISIKTSFKSPDDIYNQMIANSYLFSQRVALAQGQPINVKDPNDGNYVLGYNLTNSEVLIPSFVSAFTGKNPDKQELGYKRGFPLPNWKISYGGLKSIPFINYLFKDIRINHAYVSTYTVNGVQSNMSYYSALTGDPSDPNYSWYDLNNNRYNYYSYGNVVMAEGFAPLIGVEMTLRNNMQLKLAYNKDRISSLSLTNYTLQDDYGNELVAGLGYLLKDVKMKMRYRGRVRTLTGDLNLRGDVSLRDNQTTIRRLIERDSEVTGGQNVLSLKFSADYNFTQNFNLKFFYEQMVTKYKISTAYPLSTIRAGLSATFTFGN
jgi:cell surface protein SprA